MSDETDYKQLASEQGARLASAGIKIFKLEQALARLLSVVDPLDMEYGQDSEAAAIDQAREALQFRVTQAK